MWKSKLPRSRKQVSSLETLNRPIIGILTLHSKKPFEEPAFFRSLLKEGERLGAIVYLFSPKDVLAAERKITGFVYTDKWVQKTFPWPDIVIDRHHYLSKSAAELEPYFTLRQQSLFRFANHFLPDKLRLHGMLMHADFLRPRLPETLAYSPQELQRMLEKHEMVYLKPLKGTGGRGIVRLEMKNGNFLFHSRNRNRLMKHGKISSWNRLFEWLERWVSDGEFLIQQGLQLDIVSRHIADMRLLMQKDEQGMWRITGHGMRIGSKKSPTSNLHGGGRGILTHKILLPLFGHERVEAIVSECFTLAFETAKTIEDNCGPMMELGLDIGIDRQGAVWLIEVNAMPARNLFKQMGQEHLYRLAVRRPLQYALFLLGAMQADSL
ncbi:YheC/YheD family endospore coat-associated protein [Brevibacillus migulae]|uniref:YheC/YheD family endospore coat-associated protein n=1 Tax=Brevibacillus migulae TaxID=1644114 RepID=UPI00106EE09A|nr:YheC/YheD family protein [Brevibacillus migulae]